MISSQLSKELDACEALNDTKYAKVVLWYALTRANASLPCVLIYVCTSTWDFALLTKRQREEFSGTLAQGLRQQLCDTQVGAIAKRRSTLEVAVLGLRRAVAFLLYLVLQVAAMALILYITVRGGAIENNVSDIGFFRSLAPFFSAIVLSVVNSSVPYILKLITALETWDNPTLELNVLLFRMYFSNTFNVLILAGSYALLADPLLLAQSGLDVYRRQVEIQFNAGLHVCRMDQVRSHRSHTCMRVTHRTGGRGTVLAPADRVRTQDAHGRAQSPLQLPVLRGHLGAIREDRVRHRVEHHIDAVSGVHRHAALPLRARRAARAPAHALRARQVGEVRDAASVPPAEAAVEGAEGRTSLQLLLPSVLLPRRTACLHLLLQYIHIPKVVWHSGVSIDAT